MGDKKYTCSHCGQSGGELIGKDVDGAEVCSNCGMKDDDGIPSHFPEWSWNNFIAYNKTKKENED